MGISFRRKCETRGPLATRSLVDMVEDIEETDWGQQGIGEQGGVGLDETRWIELDEAGFCNEIGHLEEEMTALGHFEES